MPSADEIRETQRQGWNQTAALWKKWEAQLIPWQRQVSVVLLERVELRPGARVLDVACGLGDLGITAAERIGDGTVVGTDLSDAMIGYATEAARARGLTNYSARTADAGALPFADASFDTVFCQFGLMLFPEPAAGVREMHRVLAPGGRVAVAVWAQAAANPWAAALVAPVNRILNLPAPAPDAPGMFRLGEPGTVSALLTAAGFRDVVEEPVDLEQTHASGEDQWKIMREVSGGIARGLAAATPEQRAEVDRAVLAVVGTGPYTARGRAWVASATR